MPNLKNRQRTSEEIIIDLGNIPCCCGCEEEAIRTYRGLPIAGGDPQDHYNRYQARISFLEQQRSYRLPVNKQIAIINNGKGKNHKSLAHLLGEL